MELCGLLKTLSFIGQRGHDVTPVCCAHARRDKMLHARRDIHETGKSLEFWNLLFFPMNIPISHVYPIKWPFMVNICNPIDVIQIPEILGFFRLNIDPRNPFGHFFFGSTGYSMVFLLMEHWETLMLNGYPLVMSNSYWKWPFIVDLPIQNGDFP